MDNIKKFLLDQNVDAYLILSCDKYLSEYVPKNESLRAKITGFTGSLGDALILKESNHLFVDGRYEIQAQIEAPLFKTHVTKNAQSIEKTWFEFLKENNIKKIALDPEVILVDTFNELSKNFEIVFFDFKQKQTVKKYNIYNISLEFTGKSVKEKLVEIKKFLDNEDLNGLFLQKLDDLAYVTNLRADRFENQTTFPGFGILLKDKILISLDENPKNEYFLEDGIELVDKKDIFLKIKNLYSEKPLGFFAKETSQSFFLDLKKSGIKLKEAKNIVSEHKAIKNEKELLCLRKSFKKADQAIKKTIFWLKSEMEQGKQVTEKDVSNFIFESFKEEGSTSLSFNSICASKENGAIIHYSNPSHQKIIEENTLFLLDAGAYFEGGYATDLTRTFLVGNKPQRWQKTMYTLVLKASIKGLSARFRKGLLGGELDSMIRENLWQHGLDFAHGTGHGIGINVHEFPPRIAPNSNTVLKVGQVFSIEPGLYVKDLGGVRIENLATIVEDKTDNRFLRVLPLTFCPLEDILIDDSMLLKEEKVFLSYFKEEFLNENPMPNLPPLDSVFFV